MPVRPTRKQAGIDKLAWKIHDGLKKAGQANKPVSIKATTSPIKVRVSTTGGKYRSTKRARRSR